MSNRNSLLTAAATLEIMLREETDPARVEALAGALWLMAAALEAIEQCAKN